MRPLKPCRLCLKSSKEITLKKLFEKNLKLVSQIEEITGIHLKNIKNLPQHICTACLEDLERAHEFRVRCITSQEYYNSFVFRGTKGLAPDDIEIKGEMSIVDESINDPGFKGAESIVTPGKFFKPEIEIKDELPIEEKDITKFCSAKTESKDELRRNDEPNYIDENSNNSDSRSNSFGKQNDTSSLNATADDLKVFRKKSYTAPGATPKIHRKKKNNGKWVHERHDQKLKPAGTIKQKQRLEKVGFICDQCGSSFTSRCNFLAHQRRHTGEKLFHCEICPEAFFLHSELQFHVRKHTGEKPFACEFCDHRFISNNIRLKHQKYGCVPKLIL